ncbi:MAG: cell division protein ZapA [Nitrospirae bacterium]|nr:cell division protein ZapA [Nitrospirota bacterium]
MQTVEVQILGQKYSVKVDEDEAYVRSLAQYVDEKLREIYNTAPTVNHLKASIMALLNITDELFKLRMQQERLDRMIEEKTKILAGLIE